MPAFSQVGVEAVVKGVSKFTSDLGKMNTATQATGVSTGGLAKQSALLSTAMTGLEGAIGAVTLGSLAAFGRQVIETTFNLAVLGAEAARVEDSFNRVATGIGMSGSAIAAAMSEAVKGTVDDEEMMQVATKAMIMGLKLTEEEWANLAAGARYHARLIGEDTLTVFRNVVEAIQRGQPRMLTALNFAGARDAINQAAVALDATASSMTEAERSAALLQLTMKLLNGEMQQFGPISTDVIDQVNMLKVEWDNFKESLGQGFIGTAWLETMRDMMIVLDKIPKTKAQKEAAARAADASRWTALGKAFKTAAADAEVLYDALRGLTEAEIASIQHFASLTENAQAYTTTYLENIAKVGGFGVGGDLAKLRAEQEKEAADDAAKAWEDAAKESARAWESAWDSLRSDVEAALQNTEVTIWDIADTANGVYVDKWDEARRRLNAIAERGFAELQAHADWAAVLEIPPDVLSGTEQQLRNWAKQRAEAPWDLYNVDAAVAVVEQYMAKQAAHEAFIDAVTKAYAAKHGLSAKAATTAVQGAVGTTSQQAAAAVQDLPADLQKAVTAISPKVNAAATPIGDALMMGIKKGISDAWPEFMTWLIGQIGQIPAVVSEELQIHSPSAVFAGIGEEIVMGLGSGIADAQKLWKGASAGVLSASMRVGGMAAMPLMAPAGSSSRTVNHSIGGDTIVQNISDPATLYLAMQIAADRKRDRWNSTMGVT